MLLNIEILQQMENTRQMKWNEMKLNALYDGYSIIYFINIFLNKKKKKTMRSKKKYVQPQFNPSETLCFAEIKYTFPFKQFKPNYFQNGFKIAVCFSIQVKKLNWFPTFQSIYRKRNSFYLKVLHSNFPKWYLRI